jgi:muramoyltetrapeptide carboxypeptidase
MIQTIPYLNTGDTVLIVTPAKAIEEKYIHLAIALFTSWGLNVEVGKNALGQHQYFSGTDAERAEDMQWALNHPTAKAIICSRGGYGSIRIVDALDYRSFNKNPKWLIGFSDVTVFHNKFHQELNVPSIHGLAPLFLDRLADDSESVMTLKNALFGNPLEIATSSSINNIFGEVTGVLVGGNLAIIESLIGTNLDIETSGKILFIEEISEYAYKFDRMLWSLKKAGKLDGLLGLVIGGLTDMKSSDETFGMSVEDLIVEITKDYSFPVGFNFPVGHELDNRALILGYQYNLNVSSTGALLKLIGNGAA